MSISLFQVDSFTSQPFSGNPAAVCILENEMDPDWMQSVAAEMNLSETAFVLQMEHGFSLRWFTPTVEVDLCGHATLASAHVLWESGRLANDLNAVFHTQSGILQAQKLNQQIELNFPTEPADPIPHYPELAAALGCESIAMSKNRLDYLVETGNAESLRNVKPDLLALTQLGLRGVIVTARSDDDRFDFVSRFFAPGAGIDEDPVTGSAHCCLGPYWSTRLGKTKWVGFQGSSRCGVVEVELAGDRAMLRGEAVTIFEGRLFA